MPRRNIKPKTKTAGDAADVITFGKNNFVVFTDGGCHPNNKSSESRGGYAAIIVSGLDDNKQIYGNLDVDKHNASNIRAEGMGIIRAFEVINEHDTINKITMICDTEFWINMLETYMPRWSKSTFKAKANYDLTRRMWCAYQELSRKCEVVFIHVRSHNKNGWKSYEDGTYEKYCYEQNAYVDELCNYARRDMDEGDEVIENIVYKNTG